MRLDGTEVAKALAVAQRRIAELEAVRFRVPNDARQVVKDACLAVERTAVTAVPIEKLDAIIDLAVGRLAQADDDLRQKLAAAQWRISTLDALLKSNSKVMADRLVRDAATKRSEDYEANRAADTDIRDEDP
jgi:hypothetical protein